MGKIDYKGYGLTLIAYVTWGVLPIYWKQLTSIASLELIALRITITVCTLLLIAFLTRSSLFFTYLKEPKRRKQLLISAIIIAVNWGIYVYAINTDHLIQASLGYYMNPLVSVLLGIIIMKEKLTKPQYASIAFAFIGVMYLTFSYGVFPWISLILAFSFGFYGLLKKIYQLDSINSLLVETIILLPVCLMVLFYTNITSPWIVEVTSYEWMVLLFAGLISAVPLILFSDGAKRIPLSAVGFLQYIAPTLMLFIGVVIYGEAFTTVHKISFAFIWVGLLIYTMSLVNTSAKNNKIR